MYGAVVLMARRTVMELAHPGPSQRASPATLCGCPSSCHRPWNPCLQENKKVQEISKNITAKMTTLLS